MYLELTAEITAETNEQLIDGLLNIVNRLKYGNRQGIFEEDDARVNFNVEEK